MSRNEAMKLILAKSGPMPAPPKGYPVSEYAKFRDEMQALVAKRNAKTQ